MAKKKSDEEGGPETDLDAFMSKLFNEMVGSGEIPQGPEGAYRFEVQVSRDGITITPNAGGQVQSLQPQNKEPLIDIIERKDGIAVIAELPGVTKKNLELHADCERLSIKACVEGVAYNRLVQLPARVDPESAAATCNNGVLEVSFKRADTYSGIIKIELR